MRKLTLNAEETVIEDAKRIAREQGASVSSLFARWVRSFASPEPSSITIPTNSITARATGIAQLPDGLSEKDILADALAEKYGIPSR
ncbi:MAG: DUF6364 family protein [Patescibacteria group bacterium]|nr:DUF6364 family protein [Patescibacteria group bacterium]